ncbi:MAG: 50S ribosomal protein L17 [Acidobacteriota bacterium]
MRHRVAHRKLGRVTEHRLALLRNQAQALLQHEHIITTVPKAKELRPFVERLITVAKQGVAEGAANGRGLHARRLVARDINDKDTLKKLFDDLAPRYAARPGGYVRIIRAGVRKGDAAEIALVELIGSEFDPKRAQAAKEKRAEAKGEGKGIGGRLRAAAQRVRGRKTDDEEAVPAHEQTKAAKQPATRARHTGRSGKGG